MSFEAILEQIVGECGGGTAIALVGSDGIPIVVVSGPQAESNPLSDDMAGVELSRVLGEVRKASSALGGGTVDQITIRLAAFTLTVAEADEDVFVVLAQSPDGNLGKARYLIRPMSPIRFRIAAILSAALVLLAASYWLLPAPAPMDAKSVLAASVSAAIEKSAHIRRHARPKICARRTKSFSA